MKIVKNTRNKYNINVDFNFVLKNNLCILSIANKLIIQEEKTICIFEHYEICQGMNESWYLYDF